MLEGTCSALHFKYRIWLGKDGTRGTLVYERIDDVYMTKIEE